MKRKKFIILALLMLVLVAGGVLGAFLIFDDKEVAPVGNKANIEWYTEDGDEFIISTEEELYGLVKLSHYYDFSGQTIKLGADIVINDGNAKDWAKKAPAKRWYPIDGFAGTFDGQGHSISGMYGYGADIPMGMFSNTKMNCVIKDFKLLNSYFEVDGSSAVGSVASNGAGTFEKIYSDAFVTTDGENGGGLVGKINDDGVDSVMTKTSKMTNCWFDGTVAMKTKLGRWGGGLVGRIFGGSLHISHCLNSGDISAESKESNGIYIGGIFGGMSYENFSGSVIMDDTLNVGKITTKTESTSGSLAGGAYASTTMNIKNTYVTEESFTDACNWMGGSGTGSPVMVNTDFIKGEDWYSWTTLDYDKFWTVTEGGTPVLQCFADKIVDTSGLTKAYSFDWYNEYANEFIVDSVEDLYGFAIMSYFDNFANKVIKLGADIKVNEGDATTWAKGKKLPEKNWIPIGRDFNYPFQGVFDGNGHTISGLYGKSSVDFVGFFGINGIHSEIKNVKVINSYFEANGAMGSITARCEGKIDTAYSDAYLKEHTYLAGGIAGYKLTNKESKITNCWYDGVIVVGSEARYCGGIMGRVLNGTLEMSSCLFSGEIIFEGEKHSVLSGGFIGGIENGTVSVKDSLNSGEFIVAEAEAMIGVGRAFGYVYSQKSLTLTMENSYFTDDGYSGTYHYYCDGDKGTIKGGVELKRREDILGYDGYRTTGLDFTKYWTIVVNEDGTPILKSFAKKVPSVAGLEKTFDKSWYSEDKSQYILKDAKDLYGFLYLSNSKIDFKNKIIILENDIQLNDGLASHWARGENVPGNAYNWGGVGKYTSFQGTFDGQGHTISGLYGTTDTLYLGLFAYVGTEGHVENVRLTNSFLESTVEGSAAIGSIVGRLEGNIDTVYSDAIIHYSSSMCGGIVGYKQTNDVSKITNCWYDGVIVLGDSAKYAGGIMGRVLDGTLEMNSCLFSGEIIFEGAKHSVLSGGFLGGVEKGNVRVKNCLNSGEFSLAESESMIGVGRVFGYVWNSENITIKIENTYFTDDGYSGTYHYYREGNKQTIKGAAELKHREDILGYDGYRTTGLDFGKYWTVVVNEDSTPILKSFAKQVPSVSGLAKIFDKSWYSEDKNKYVLKDTKDLYGFMYLSNSNIDFKGKTIVLKNDIKLNDGKASDWAKGENVPDHIYNWEGIGKYTNFQGTFDGQGHTISGLYGTSDTPSLGLFASVGIDGSVKDMSLKNTFFESTATNMAKFGSIVGRLEGDIDTVYSDAILYCSSSMCGGIVGYKESDDASKITNCWYDGDLIVGSDAKYCGGIMGRAYNGTLDMSSCLFSGQMIFEGAKHSVLSGGFIGGIEKGTVSVNDCLNSGKFILEEAEAMNGVGRVFGYVWGSSKTTVKIEDTYFTNDGYSGTDYYYCEGDSQRITGCAELKGRETILGYDGYRTTSLDFGKYWAVVVDEDSTPILKSFAKKTPSVIWLGKTFDKSWYSEDEERYVLKNAKDLYGFLYLSNSKIDFKGKTIVLEKDIELNDGMASDWAEGKNLPDTVYNWSGIGKYTTFQGTFDGQGHSISGLYGTTDTQNLGLFAYVGTNGSVKDMSLKNTFLESTATNMAKLGSIVGRLEGDIHTVYSDAILYCSSTMCGGIVGYKESSDVSKITNCWYDGIVIVGSAAKYCGGIMGRAYNGTLDMSSCLFSGQMIFEGAKHSVLSGGFIGGIEKGTVSVNDCLNSGEFILEEAEAMTGVGRVFGYVYGSPNTTVTIKDTYFTNEGYSGTYHYYCDGDQTRVTGSAEVKNRNDILGYNGYQTTTLNFEQYWTVVVDEDSTPILKSFAQEVPSVEGVEKIFDTSWYSEDENSYVLKDAKDMYGFLYLSNTNLDFKDKTIVLEKDIELNDGLASDWAKGKNVPSDSYDWSGIGKQTAFQGTFDGQGHTISGLYGTTNTPNFGLFAHVGTDGVVKNVSLKNTFLKSTAQGNAAIGSIVGRLEGDIETVYSNAIVYCSNVLSGGIAGYKETNDVSKITNCWYDGMIVLGENAKYSGGIMGRVLNGTLEMNSCLFSGEMVFEGAKHSVLSGGFVGGIEKGTVSVNDCLNSGEFILDEAEEMTGVGRVFGYVWGSSNTTVTIKDTYFTNEGYSATYHYYCDGDQTRVTGSAELRDRDDILGYNGYQTMALDFEQYWTVVVDEDSTPILKSFVKEVPSVEGFEKIIDTSWYSADENRYVLRDAKDLYGFMYLSNSNLDFKGKIIVLENDIKLNDGLATDWATGKNVPLNVYNWDGIGRYTTFQGTFDGQGNTISGLYCEHSGEKVGLFAYTGANSKIQNIRLSNSYISGTNYIGSVVGYAQGQISNVNSDAIVQGSQYVGGIIGACETGNLNITNCNSTNKVSATVSYAGGIIGFVDGGVISIEGSCFEGELTANRYYAGGLLGHVSAGTVTITGSSVGNAGKVTAAESTGGLVGYAQGGTVTINGHSSFAGTVTAGWATGGLVGRVAGTVNFDNASFEGTCNMNGSTFVGGFVGHVQSGSVSVKEGNSDGTISAVNGYYAGGLIGNVSSGEVTIYKGNFAGELVAKETAGGLVGYVQGGKIILNESGVVGDVTANWAVGGLVGRVKASTATVEIKNSSFNGACNLTGSTYAGGLVGLIEDGTVSIEGSDSDGNVTANTGYYVGGVIGSVNAGTVSVKDCASVATTITAHKNSDNQSFAGGIIGNVKAGTVTVENTNYGGILTASGYYAGGLIGNVSEGTVTITGSGVSSAGQVTGAESSGGLVGYVQGGTVTINGDSSFAGTISAGWGVGGLVGRVAGTVNFENASFEGTCNLTGSSYAGGFVGHVQSGSVSVRESNAIGTISAANGYYAGGLIGNVSAGEVTIYKGDFAGQLTAKETAGGLVGFAQGGKVIVNESAFTGEVTANWAVGGLVSRVKNATVEIKNSRYEQAGVLNCPKYTGGLVGYVDSGNVSINSCHVTGNLNPNGAYAGGLVGGVIGGTMSIERSYYEGILTANGHYVGGIIGYITTTDKVDIKKCYVEGTVETTNNNIGGLIGAIHNAGSATITMEDCLNKAKVESPDSWLGGLIGRIVSCTPTVKLTRCLNMGTVKGKSRVGSLIGQMGDANITVTSVYATKTSEATGTDTAYVGVAVGDNVLLANVTMIENLTDITVSNTVSADTIKNTLRGLFGADSVWTIGTTIGSAPELQLK